MALPLLARMLAGEEDAAERPGEPLAKRRVVLMMVERIPAARPRLVFPADRIPRHKIRVAQVEPAHLIDQARGAARLQHLAGFQAGASTRHQREDAVLAVLFFVAVPHGSQRQIGAERAGLAAL